MSDAERAAVTEADEWLQHNQPIPHEEVLAESGLTMADWDKLGQPIFLSTRKPPGRLGDSTRHAGVRTPRVTSAPSPPEYWRLAPAY